jgi:hypothetical protein
MKYIILPTIIAMVVCILTYLFSGSTDDDATTTANKTSNSQPNYLVTFLVTFCVVAIISYVFSGDDGGHMKGGAGGAGSLKAVMREINIGDPDF